jgi:hypothetical protein
MTDNSDQTVTTDGKGPDPRLAKTETDRGTEARAQTPVDVIRTEITTATTIVTDKIAAGAEIEGTTDDPGADPCIVETVTDGPTDEGPVDPTAETEDARTRTTTQLHRLGPDPSTRS